MRIHKGKEKEEKTEMFKKISVAYTCLSDPSEREKYDERIRGRYGGWVDVWEELLFGRG